MSTSRVEPSNKTYVDKFGLLASPAQMVTSTKIQKITYRRLEEKDFQNLTTLCFQTYKESYGEQLNDKELEEIFGEKYLTQQLPAEFKNENILYILALHESQLIGYAKLEYVSDKAKLSKLYLLQNYQNKGYGKELIIKCCEDAIARNKNCMELIVWEENKKGIHFYEKICGFTEISRIPLQGGNVIFKDILMRQTNVKALLDRFNSSLAPIISSKTSSESTVSNSQNNINCLC